MFFDRFKELSMFKGKSTTAIGEELGINKSTVSYWRNNPKAAPKLEALQQLADYFNVSTDYLLGNTDIKNPPDKQNPEDIAKVALFGGDGEVSDEMWQEVKDYVAYIKQKHFKDDDK